MKRKYDGCQRDMVGSIMNELLVNTSHYITTGVPPHVLITRVSIQLTVNAGESDVNKFQKKAKELIEHELKNETLVRFPSGNYLHGPRKADAGQLAASGDESDSALVSAEEEDDDEEEEEDDHQGKKDTDYSPTYIPKNFSRRGLKQGEGRTSGRMKKSRFDANEYIFPTIVKNLTKKSPVVQEKVRRRPGPKPKKKCPICTLYSTADHPLATTCKTCPVRAHTSCVETDMSTKGKDLANWICCYCKPVTKKWICVKCEEVAGKDKGILLSCEGCNLKYHRTCHSPPVQPKNIKNSVIFRCSSCVNKSMGKKEADSSYLEESQDESNLDFTLRCYVCHNKFYNIANKLKCAECKYLFHARCCRVRTAENAARLGSKRHKWKCDECIVTHSGLKQAASCRVVIPRLQLKTERKSDSSDESASCKRSRRRPKKRGRPARNRSPSDDGLDKEDEEDEMKEDPQEADNAKPVAPKDHKEWWVGRLKPITVGRNQPLLGPIPDLSVPDISGWSSSDVNEYFNEYFLDKSVGQVFVDQDIDGKALKLMRRIDVLRTFDDAGFKLDIIMDVMQHVKRLQLRVNDRRYIWADIF